jgi:predicted MFS family arabinose efflux permease
VATFGVGFITRPLGGVLFGAYADRYGRKPAMTLTIVLMAVACAAIGLLPTYDSIGIAAPILLVFSRLLQGCAAGGVMGAATNYLLEAAPRERRSFFGSWQAASQSLAQIVIGLVGFGVGVSLAPASLQSWGWRVPFLIGLSVLPVGLYIRANLDETFDPPKAHHSMSAVVADLLAHHKATLVLCILMISGATITQYFVGYMPTYALAVLHLPPSVALSAAMIYGVCGSVGAVVGGIAADRYFNRYVVIIAPRLLLIVALWPVLLTMNAHPSMAVFYAGIGLFQALQGLSLGVLIILIPACFPLAVRTTGLSVAYTVGVAIFGGTAQVVFTWLIGSTGSPMSPAYYLIAINLVTVAAAVALRQAERTYRDA